MTDTLEQVVLAHLPLVRRCAWGLRDRGEQVDDLIQVGTIGLISAFQRYDAARGVPFEAYAAATVRGEMRRHLRDRSRLVRAPRVSQGQLPVQVVPWEEDQVEPAAPEESGAADDRLLLEPVLARLEPLERAVLVLHDGHGWPQHRVAAELGLSQAGVSRTRAAALARLRRWLRASGVERSEVADALRVEETDQHDDRRGGHAPGDR